MLTHIPLSRAIWLRSPDKVELTVHSVGQAFSLLRNVLPIRRRSPRHWIAADYALTRALTVATSGAIETATAAIETALTAEGWPYQSLPPSRPREIGRRRKLRGRDGGLAY